MSLPNNHDNYKRDKGVLMKLLNSSSNYGVRWNESQILIKPWNYQYEQVWLVSHEWASYHSFAYWQLLLCYHCKWEIGISSMGPQPHLLSWSLGKKNEAIHEENRKSTIWEEATSNRNKCSKNMEEIHLLRICMEWSKHKRTKGTKRMMRAWRDQGSKANSLQV